MLAVKNHSFLLKILTIFSLGCVFSGQISGREGVWNPTTLRRLEDSMKAHGLAMPIEQVYNEDGTGLNNAVVLFSRNCTGEIISPKGLLLTNRHCGYGSVQGLTNLENDYVAKGFFAAKMEDEIPCPGLTVSFVRKMENVTSKVLPLVNDTLHDHERDSIISGRIGGLEREYEMKTGLEAAIKPFFDGNQYWVILTETYRDIRLVGFPQKGIGGFGGDIENWSWPSHIGDFSMFRIYAGTDNKPASYAKTNVPYNASQFFKINTSGYKEGDFTMVYGFPGSTYEYISSHELSQVTNITYPIAIEARTKKLAIWKTHTDASKTILQQYSGKRSGIDGGLKKWSGEMVGLKRDSVIAQKKTYEKGFQTWATNNIEEPYAENLLPRLAAAAKDAENILTHDQYIRESLLGIEIIPQGSVLERFAGCFRLNLSDSALSDTLQKMTTSLAWFYKNYDQKTDKDVFKALLPLYLKKCEPWLPDYYRNQYKAHKKNINKWATYVYDSSLVASQERLLAFAAHAQAADSNRVLRDPAWQLFSSISTLRREKLIPNIEAYRSYKHYLNRLYQKARMAYEFGKDIYPDANLTLRLSYGHIKGLQPDHLKTYSFHTSLSDIIALDKPGSEFFDVPAKLKELQAKKDFGRWAERDTLFTTFIADNHTTGGNSGSPVLNAKGELIGLNYDRALEGVMSDYYYDPARFRNTSVDIRYILFVIDKIGGANWMINEMTLVK